MPAFLPLFLPPTGGIEFMEERRQPFFGTNSVRASLHFPAASGIITFNFLKIFYIFLNYIMKTLCRQLSFMHKNFFQKLVLFMRWKTQNKEIFFQKIFSTLSLSHTFS